jgi:hypothetical protein
MVCYLIILLVFFYNAHIYLVFSVVHVIVDAIFISCQYLGIVKNPSWKNKMDRRLLSGTQWTMQPPDSDCPYVVVGITLAFIFVASSCRALISDHNESQRPIGSCLKSVCVTHYERGYITYTGTVLVQDKKWYTVLGAVTNYRCICIYVCKQRTYFANPLCNPTTAVLISASGLQGSHPLVGWYLGVKGSRQIRAVRMQQGLAPKNSCTY